MATLDPVEIYEVIQDGFDDIIWPGNGTYENATDLEICFAMVDNVPYLLHAMFGTSLFYIIVLSFLTKRKYRFLHACCGRPGLVLPLNLLDTPINRWAYACAFGSISNVILVFFLSGSTFFESTALWVRVSSSLLAALEICICFLPFFASLTTDSPIAGPIIGFLFASGWSFMLGVFTLICANPLPESAPYIGLALELPALVCILFLTGNYVRLAILGCKCQKPAVHEDIVAFPVHKAYVMDLLAGDIKHNSDTTDKKWWQVVLIKIRTFANTYIIVRKKNYMFSARIICTVVVGAFCIYQLQIILYGYMSYILYQWRLVDKSEIATATITMLNICTWVAFVLEVGQVVFILGKYRYDTLLLYKGDKSFLPPKYEPNKSTMLRMSMLFSGYQIAYMMWGFIILSIGLLIFGILFSVLILLPAIYGYWNLIWAWVEPLAIPLIMSFVLRIIQLLLARFVFLLPKTNESDEDKPLAITNRRFFHITNYFFFLANIAIGLFSCLYRIGIGMLFGLLFLGRLDRPVLMAGFETMDTGHMAYLGTILLEEAHNHPVLRVFCHLLLDELNATSPTVTKAPNSVSPGFEEMGEMADQKARRRLVARNKWHVAYTLIKNPSLVQHRMREMEEEEEEKETFLQHVTNNKMFLKLRQKFKALDDWALELENGSSINSSDDEAEDIGKARGADGAMAASSSASKASDGVSTLDSVSTKKSVLGKENEEKFNLQGYDNAVVSISNGEIDQSVGKVECDIGSPGTDRSSEKTDSARASQRSEFPPIRYAGQSSSSNGLKMEKLHGEGDNNTWSAL